MVKYNFAAYVAVTATAALLQGEYAYAYGMKATLLENRNLARESYLDDIEIRTDDAYGRGISNNDDDNDDYEDYDDLYDDDEVVSGGRTTDGEDTTGVSDDVTDADDDVIIYPVGDDAVSNDPSDTGDDGTEDSSLYSCVDNKDGTFGDVTSYPINFRYDYEMVTYHSTDVESKISALERSIADLILKSDALSCGRRKLTFNLRRKLGLTGLDPIPADILSSDGCVLATYGGNTRCDVVEGRLTLYSDGFDSESDVAKVKNLIKSSMEDGTLAATDDEIIEVFFFENENNVIDSPINTGGVGTTQRKAEGGINAAPIFASVACAAVLVGFLAGRRMLKKDEDETIEEESQDNSLDEDNELDIAGIESDDSNIVNQSAILNGSGGSVTVSSSFAR